MQKQRADMMKRVLGAAEEKKDTSQPRSEQHSLIDESVMLRKIKKRPSRGNSGELDLPKPSASSVKSDTHYRSSPQLNMLVRSASTSKLMSDAAASDIQPYEDSSGLGSVKIKVPLNSRIDI